MPNSIYHYTVFDKQEHKNIIEKATTQEIQELLGINGGTVSRRANDGYALRRRYLISKERIDGKDIGGERAKTTRIPQALADEWDRVCLELNPLARGISEDFRKAWDEACLAINPKARG